MHFSEDLPHFSETGRPFVAFHPPKMHRPQLDRAPPYPGHGLSEIAVGKCDLQLCAEHGIETGLATLERLCPENGSGIRSRSWRLGFFWKDFLR